MPATVGLCTRSRHALALLGPHHPPRRRKLSGDGQKSRTAVSLDPTGKARREAALKQGIIAVVALAIGIGGSAGEAAAQAGDRDCSDFSNQSAAQAFYIAAGGPASDPHQLDGDRNGIACESLPCPCGTASAPPPTQPTTPVQPPAPAQPGSSYASAEGHPPRSHHRRHRRRHGPRADSGEIANHRSADRHRHARDSEAWGADRVRWPGRDGGHDQALVQADQGTAGSGGP